MIFTNFGVMSSLVERGSYGSVSTMSLKFSFPSGRDKITVCLKGTHPNLVFILEVVVKFLEERSCIGVRADLDELDAELEVRVRSTTKQRTRPTYLGEGCTVSIQLFSDMDNGILRFVSCSLGVSELRLTSTRDNSLAAPSVMMM